MKPLSFNLSSLLPYLPISPPSSALPYKSTSPASKHVNFLTHEEATRKNIPTAEYQSVMAAEEPTRRGNMPAATVLSTRRWCGAEGGEATRLC
jgi:hypothetical protein